MQMTKQPPVLVWFVTLCASCLFLLVNGCENDRKSFHFDLGKKIQNEDGINPNQIPPPAYQSPFQSKLEKAFRAIPSATAAKTSLRKYTSIPHMAGTKEDFELAEYTKQEWEKAGLDEVRIEKVKVLLSYPKEAAKLSLVSKADGKTVLFRAELAENIEPTDSTSNTIFRNKTFNGYSPSGKVKAQLVYANFGLPEDFDFLDRLNVSVKNRIVIVRYGKAFRGLKVMNAQKRGAVGVLIYSDPQQDGFSIGNTYPNGPWRPESSVQRGSIQFNSLCSGDVGRKYSKKSVKDICGYEEKDLYPKIPTLPISWKDAVTFLQHLKGELLVDSDWIGSLDMQYHTGPSSDLVALETNNEFVTGEIPNVIGVLKSDAYATQSDRVVVLGNHRDAWVFGAADPNSGSAILNEVVKGMGHLKKTFQWKPKRSLVFASWSGEELGLLGSTAFGEMHEEDLLLKNAVAYLNVDVGVSGPMFELASSAVLTKVVESVLKDVTDPTTKNSLYDEWNKKNYVLGTGSDYSVFVDHLGISSFDIRFSPKVGEGHTSGVGYGTYHSIYDSFDWMERFGDENFKYHQTMSLVWGLIALRISESTVLPYSLKALGASISQMYAHAYEEAYVKLGGNNALVKTQFSQVKRSISRLERAIALFESKVIIMRKAQKFGVDSKVNDVLGFVERRFLTKDGLPLRKFFKNVLYAPALYLGYGADVFPGVFQTLRDEKLNYPHAEKELKKIYACVSNATDFILSALPKHEEEDDVMIVAIQ